MIKEIEYIVNWSVLSIVILVIIQQAIQLEYPLFSFKRLLIEWVWKKGIYKYIIRKVIFKYSIRISFFVAGEIMQANWAIKNGGVTDFIVYMYLIPFIIYGLSIFIALKLLA